MKELEQRSGVGRETIRFYIRKGLLPAPHKPKKNVAAYTDEHVERLALIQELQHERFMPLDLIKSLLDPTTGNRLPDHKSLRGLEFSLASRLGIRKSQVPLKPLLTSLSLTMGETTDMEALGLIKIRHETGKETLSEEDGHVLRIWSQIKAAGFNEELGYDVQSLDRHNQAAKLLARLDSAEFLRKISNRKTREEAVKMAESGIALTNELLHVLRNKAIIRELGQANPWAENDGDNGDRINPVSSKPSTQAQS